MNSKQSSEHETVEAYQQHTENSHFESEFGISGEVVGQSIDANAKLDAAGAAARQAAEQFSEFCRCLLQIVKVVSLAIVAIMVGLIVKAYIQASN